MSGAYIAAQAPVSASVEDFWRMMKDYKNTCIVLLCNLKEDGAVSTVD